MNASEHLEEYAWKTPECYGGFDPVGDYCILSRCRDSVLVDEVNWEVACKALDAEDYDDGDARFSKRPTVYTFRAGHWAVGWVEYLMVRQDAPEEIRTHAGEIVCSLADYPILDDELHSQREYEAMCEYWERCSIRDRVEYLQEAGLSIFAARRDELPESDWICERLREGL